MGWAGLCGILTAVQDFTVHTVSRGQGYTFYHGLFLVKMHWLADKILGISLLLHIYEKRK